MGMSDGDDSMNFPYIEADTDYHSLKNLGIKECEDKKVELVVLKGELTSDDYEHLK